MLNHQYEIRHPNQHATDDASIHSKNVKKDTRCSHHWIISDLENQSDQGPQISITDYPFTIGRSNENDLTIPVNTVSSQHARLEVVGPQLVIHDLQSTNGSFINGERFEGSCNIKNGDIVHLGTVAIKLSLEETKHVSEEATLRNMTIAADAEENAISQILFERLVKQKLYTPYFQPIVKLDDKTIVGYESLCRSQLSGLETADKIFQLACSRQVEVEVSQDLRLVSCQQYAIHGPDLTLFLNTHPNEFQANNLIASMESLREKYPELPMMLEVHESAVTSIPKLVSLQQELKALKIGLAFDDFGSGQSRLTELINIAPEIIKFDQALVKPLGESAFSRSILESLTKIVIDRGTTPLAEGIESQEQADICSDYGIRLGQGYFFGKPISKTKLANHDTTSLNSSSQQALS